ncbi:acetyl-CoA carboxylase [Marmoricola endophyticus]|uniref:Acetyl-CoA carboxylase n=1 Tax=Marmoricola endophyticus TaxID=2040280 RepID=A0A917BT77_9ACTN|nr:carboxyl transferase domain-containing protein [Marmoricola endophyticus]GGF53598.1 acetyl-CoA carboxylase [Marmoricola endophyticus]
MSRRLGAQELIDRVLDAGSWVSWDAEADEPAEPGSAYAAELAAARARAGTDESIITGRGTVSGRPVAVVASEFGFLGGSMGRAASARLHDAVRRATREGLPLVAAPCSGGTRMQEGTPAFLGMVKVAAAITAHRGAGLPYLVYLRHPTTGGVFASWGSLGHFTAAEPGALVGFLGPRVFEALHGRPFPEGVQTAENLLAHGLLDAVIEVDDLAQVASQVLDVLMAPREVVPVPPGLPLEDLGTADAWESVERSRRPDRPGVRDLLRRAADVVIPLSGTAQGEVDDTMLLCLARFGTTSCVVLGQDRRHQSGTTSLGPAGLREARRGMSLARELGLPLVSVIDTAGAELSRAAEEGGLAGEIARCLAELVVLEAPTLCLMLGEGAGGGALALLPADRVVAAEHSWLSPLPPEGAAAILHRDVGRAAEVAAAQRVSTRDLLDLGVVDRVVAEPADAGQDAEVFCDRLALVLQHELAVLVRVDPRDRLRDRLERYARLG